MAPPWHRRLRALRGAVCAPAAGERPCIAPCPAAAGGAAEPRGLTADELATYEEDVRAPLPRLLIRSSSQFWYRDVTLYPLHGSRSPPPD